MSVEIPFRRELEFEYGRVDLISPPGAVPVRRVIARNPSAFTLYGTGTYIVCLLYTSPSPRDGLLSRMPSSA